MVSRMFCAVLVSSVLTLCGATALAQNANPYEKLVTQHASAMVNIKFILKAEGQEQEEETPGVMIEKDGLVLSSNVAFGGLAAMFGGPAVQPADIKILIGEDTQGVEAKLIARDSELGLAWLRIDKPDANGYAFVDFSKGAPARTGDAIMALSQLGKFFDRASLVTEGRVACTTKKPRTLFIPSLTLAGTDFGVPAFDSEARPVGVFTIVLPEKEEIQSAPGGMQEILKGVAGGKMILPSEDVVAATKRAKETAASGAAEPAAAGAEPADPKAEPKKDEPAPATAPK